MVSFQNHPYQQLTERDVQVVLSVYKHKYLTTSQIQTLHFPSETTCNRRLRRLIQHGYLKPFTILNVPERMFTLTHAGAELVAGTQGITADELLWKPSPKVPKDHYFMRHFVSLNDFRIAITQATEHSPVRLLGFIPEYYGGQRHSSGRVTKYIRDVVFDVANPRDQISHAPDAVLSLEKNGKPALFFLEIDRGTEPLSNPERGVLKMLRFYLAFHTSGNFKGYAEDFGVSAYTSFRTLIVTTSPKRIENMQASATRNLPENLQRGLQLIWVAPTTYINSKTILSPFWKSLYSPESRRYKLG